MAKESMKAREVKRAKLVAKYAAKRQALKQIVRAGDTRERLTSSRKRYASPVRLHNRCSLTGRPKGYMRALVSAESSSVRWPATVSSRA